MALFWVLPLVLMFCGYVGMWLLFPPADSPSSDRVDPGFPVLLFGLLFYRDLVVLGLLVIAAIAARQLWHRREARRRARESAVSP